MMEMEKAQKKAKEMKTKREKIVGKRRMMELVSAVEIEHADKRATKMKTTLFKYRFDWLARTDCPTFQITNRHLTKEDFPRSLELGKKKRIYKTEFDCVKMFQKN